MTTIQWVVFFCLLNVITLKKAVLSGNHKVNKAALGTS